jgi:hypothetical protein
MSPFYGFSGAKLGTMLAYFRLNYSDKREEAHVIICSSGTYFIGWIRA